MREAESNLAVKELRQRLAELEQHWAKYVHMRAFDPSVASIEKDTAEIPQQQPSPPLTSARYRLNFVCILKDNIVIVLIEQIVVTYFNGVYACLGLVWQKLRHLLLVNIIVVFEVMELETQNHVCTNQLKRQDDEIKRVREELDSVQKNRKELEISAKQEKQRCVQKESELNELYIMERLKYSEAMQSIQDLRQTITQLELKKAEKWTQNQLRGTSVCDVDDDSNSHASIGSNGDALSLVSEDMNALIADMTVRVPVLNNLVEEESATETENRPEEKHDGNDTTDSGNQSALTSCHVRTVKVKNLVWQMAREMEPFQGQCSAKGVSRRLANRHRHSSALENTEDNQAFTNSNRSRRRKTVRQKTDGCGSVDSSLGTPEKVQIRRTSSMPSLCENTQGVFYVYTQTTGNKPHRVQRVQEVHFRLQLASK
uniref:Kinesin motor domain-containing protein n=1 Tax=Heterorhabditis bacteriophora TaxID=37862 RepID=A0A1I7XC62_HETBA